MDIKPIEDLHNEIENRVWAKLRPQMRQISEDISRMEKDNPKEAMALLVQYPEILTARKVIYYQKKMWRFANPNIAS